MESSPCKEDGDDSTPSHAVGVSLCDSTPLLWRVPDLRTVRSHGLVGSLLGSLPRTPRQNGHLGRPLLLLPEEERLLKYRQAAAALPAANQDIGGAELQKYEQEKRWNYEQQSILALEDKKSALLQAMMSSCTESHLESHLEGLDRGFVFPHSALSVQLSTARAGLSYCPEARVLLQADWPIRVKDEPRSDLRYQVFKELTGQGFYLTSAGKFGGDFLVYPDDPLRFHAHFIAICVSMDESLPLLDVLTVARLGSNVKKTVLLCSPVASGHIMYTSLQWSGIV